MILMSAKRRPEKLQLFKIKSSHDSPTDQITEGGPEIDKILKEAGEMELKSALEQKENMILRNQDWARIAEKDEEFTFKNKNFINLL